MPRIRSVKPEFWSSPDIASLSVPTRLVFIGLWNFAEDNGVGLADERALRSQLFPMDDFGESSTNVRRALCELSSGGLIDLFEARGRRLYKINGWRHQKIDKANQNPRYLTPDQYGDEAVSCGDSPFDERSANDRGEVAEPSRPRARARQDQGEDRRGSRSGSSAASRVDLTRADEDQNSTPPKASRSGPDPTDIALRAVREFTPRGTDAGTRRRLAQLCDTARADEASWTAIEHGLIAWSKHPDCTAALLPSLITNAVKVESGAQLAPRPQVSTTASRVGGALALLRPDGDEPPDHAHQLPPGKIS